MREGIVRVMVVGSMTFFLTIILSLWSQLVLGSVGWTFALFFLIIIILIGILFDAIGVAAAAADADPFNAMAAKRIPGSKEALSLVLEADKVVTFCNDVVGDICGTVSGAIGASIVFRLIQAIPDLNSFAANILIVALIAALTVGGKAYGKIFALREWERIIFSTGRVLYWFNSQLGISLFGKRKTNKRRGRR